MTINLEPIGFIHTPYKDDAPDQPQEEEKGHYLELKKEYLEALSSLESFNYIYVIFYLHQMKKNIRLRLNKNDAQVGLFATRTPNRPNPIGLSIVKILNVSENRIYISGIDALNMTPILDIKPYIKDLDIKEDSNSGWIVDKRREKNMIYLYTDGACSGNPGPGGYAAIIKQGNLEQEITGFEPETTNNRMELMAVIEGLKEIPSQYDVKVYSDSNYVLKGLMEWLKKWKANGWKTASNKPVKNKDLWQELDRLANSFSLDFVKVKGHSGHEYNERVDTLAREQIENYSQ